MGNYYREEGRATEEAECGTFSSGGCDGNVVMLDCSVVVVGWVYRSCR